MKEFKFNMAFIAMYSPRPGAASYRWEDEVSQDVKKERLHRLSEEMKKHTRIYNEQLVGKTMRVLVNGCDRKTGFSNGLTEGKINVRLNREASELMGQIIDVKITSAADMSLSGEILSEAPISRQNQKRIIANSN
jgi:tRNA-2-methylthio-N6-dimethylallyladenosine synthase